MVRSNCCLVVYENSENSFIMQNCSEERRGYNFEGSKASTSPILKIEAICRQNEPAWSPSHYSVITDHHYWPVVDLNGLWKRSSCLFKHLISHGFFSTIYYLWDRVFTCRCLHDWWVILFRLNQWLKCVHTHVCVYAVINNIWPDQILLHHLESNHFLEPGKQNMVQDNWQALFRACKGLINDSKPSKEPWEELPWWRL